MSKDNIKRVQEFHDVCGEQYLTSPGIPDKKVFDHRLDLLQEEFDELEVALNQNNLSEVLDALVDIQYILHGAILDCGMQDVFDEAEIEVHRSNMSKFCKNTDQARDSVIALQLKGVEAYYRLVNQNFIIRRSIDDKILKGQQFSQPRLKRILKRNKAAKPK